MTGPSWFQDKRGNKELRRPFSGRRVVFTHGEARACSQTFGQCVRCLRTFNWSGMGVHLRYCAEFHPSRLHPPVPLRRSPPLGQYFIAVNETRREWLHPHRFGDGLKFMEFAMSSTGFVAGLATLLRRSNEGGGGDLIGYYAPSKALEDNPIVGSWAGDKISIVGDYDHSRLFQIAMGEIEGEPGWRDVSEPVIEAMCKDEHAKGALRARLNWWKDNTREDSPERIFFAKVFGPDSPKTFQEEPEKGAMLEGGTKIPPVPGFQEHE